MLKFGPIFAICQYAPTEVLCTCRIPAKIFYEIGPLLALSHIINVLKKILRLERLTMLFPIDFQSVTLIFIASELKKYRNSLIINQEQRDNNKIYVVPD